MALPVFPTLPGLAFPVGRTPVWSTLAQDSWSGKSVRLQSWTSPRRRYTLAYEVLRSLAATELQALEGFYNLVGGSAQPFLFADVDDQAASGVPFGIGDGATTLFQLLRPWGGFSEPVLLPRAGFQVFLNGAAVSTASYAIGSNPGQILMNAPPALGAVLTWTGGFDWMCRFDADSVDFSKFTYGRWSIDKLAFTTVKL